MKLDWDSHEALQVARRKLARLVQPDNAFPNEKAFELLYLHFVENVDKKVIADSELGPGKDHTQVNKLLAKREGKESSRRVDVRRIFFETMEAMGTPIHVDQQQRTTKKGSRGTGRTDRRQAPTLLELYERDRSTKDGTTKSESKEQIQETDGTDRS